MITRFNFSCDRLSQRSDVAVVQENINVPIEQLTKVKASNSTQPTDGGLSPLASVRDDDMGIAEAFLGSARVSRAELYGVSPDRQMPENLVDDAHIPFLGFAGAQYWRGGVVLLAINPGGGGDSYQIRTPQDNQLLPHIVAFTKSSPDQLPTNFATMSSNYAAQVRTWNLWRILDPTLEACGKDLSEVAYLNCFPYRTCGDRMPQAGALRASWTNVVEPLIAQLRPSTLIALGKKVGGVAERQFRGPGKLYVVPRTIGDSYVSEEARMVLARVRQDAVTA